ncbi:hypothetical protein L226DRAFT_548363 [Lentinus tigrinus ALCF2SS1-7]|uniref:C2H2-type domain-containing protein n=1 Tax=Lentinus tigrinus ALCF2SS1-6 TaxID=1328759 RepID=A0A5C2RSG2_9APHY|nr:hypothetical protein L227DRAFT_589068 [Lentinus tigrinus ALCF2SS1-6]RPD68854.1 hypothetical protein L226DRAFT_548363 [Lentinus tigrinus ALCF2SS1-7]
MARCCNICRLGITTERGYRDHMVEVHRWPKPPPPLTRKIFHPTLNARPCNVHGNFLPAGVPPPPREEVDDWWPFSSRAHFEFADWHYQKVQTSVGDLDTLLKNLAAQKALETGNAHAAAMFDSANDLLATIDAIPYGELAWTTFNIRYTGPVTPHTPAWKLKTYTIHTRNALHVAEDIAGSADFDGRWDYVPYEEYNTPGCRRFSDVMSGTWAFKKGTTLAANADYAGSMLTPVIIGTDKTTVSVATGHQEFHPVYLSLGNVHNTMRRAHRNAVVPLAFLAIPKRGRAPSNDDYRAFVKELYHTSLARILSPLRPGMTTPHVMHCPDGHFRRALFELGPVIADYPEQVCLSGIVSGWCPKCCAYADELRYAGRARFRAHTEALVDTFSPAILWDVFGVNADVEPFTSYFPRADIHELLTPDLLHQLIKGTFKDHLVDWITDYVKMSAPTEQEAADILDQIDIRLNAVPPFPGLRRFPTGRNFTQWTGDDSKGLMKIYLSAINGLVPTQIVQCVTALLDFAYLARRSEHDTFTLEAMEEALAYFHQLREIFVEVGVRPNGFNLPRQHALVHYVQSIKMFGSPNGLCSSITESKHIEAVKETWRRGSRHQPIGQMVRCLTRLSKMSAVRVEFGRRGMLHGDVLTAARLQLEDEEVIDLQTQREEAFRAAQAEQDARDAGDLGRPQLHLDISRFLYERLFPDGDYAADMDMEEYPHISMYAKVGEHQSATVVYHAPSERSGPHGMRREIVRCNPLWYNLYPRYDTVLWGMPRFRVARLRRLLSIPYNDVFQYDAAFVEWFTTHGRDASTGMWVVCPEMDGEVRVSSIIPLSSIAPVGDRFIPADFHFADALDAFDEYHVNCYVDYHAHETIV